MLIFFAGEVLDTTGLLNSVKYLWPIDKMGGSTDVVLKPELEQILSGYVSIRKRILSANILIKIHCIVHIDAFVMI